MIETERLLLREWREEDIPYFAAINQDPRVMEFLLKPLTDVETKALVERFRRHHEEHGFCLFACILKENSECIGFLGLNVPPFTASFTPCVEIAWRLASKAWGKGYATEGAKAVLESAFNTWNLKEVVAFTVPMNKRSIRVMEKLGMKRDLSGDFDHPLVPPAHRLLRHVL